MNTMSTPLRTGKLETEFNREVNEKVRRRAYELYEQRGRKDGHDAEDWFQAGSEMIQTKVEALAA